MYRCIRRSPSILSDLKFRVESLLHRGTGNERTRTGAAQGYSLRGQVIAGKGTDCGLLDHWGAIYIKGMLVADSSNNSEKM